MAKSKVITNQSPKEDLEATIRAVEDTSVTRDPKVVVQPSEPVAEDVVETNDETTEETGLSLEDVKQKDPSELTDEEQTFLEDNQDNLTDEEKAKFNIETDKSVSLPTQESVEELKEEVRKLKERYAGSTREGQVLSSRTKQFNEVVAKAGEMSEPSDKEMEEEYGDSWEIMDDIQRRVAKEAILAKKQFKLVHDAFMDGKKTDEWIDKVHQYSIDPQVLLKFPQLEGKDIEFAQFCSIPSRVGGELEDLVKAFTFDIKEEPAKRKSLFQTGSVGQTMTVKKEMSVEEVTFLRKNNQKRYKELLKAGKIKIEI